jgi:RecA-family ATPase
MKNNNTDVQQGQAKKARRKRESEATIREDTLDEVLAEVEEPMEWIVDGLIARGSKTLLVGAPKAGKTFMALYLSLAAATGSRFLDKETPSKGCKVLYVNFELGRRAWHNRIRQVAKGMDIEKIEGARDHFDQFKSLTILGYFPLDKSEEAVSRLDREIGRYKPQVLVLDPKRNCYGGKEKSSEDTLEWCHQIDNLMVKHGLAVLVVHHTTKNEYRDIVNRAAGSNALAGWADIITALRRDREQVIMETVTRFEEEPPPLRLVLKDGRHRLLPEGEQKVGERWAQAIKVIKERYENLPEGVKVTQMINEVNKETSISLSYLWKAWRHVSDDLF